MNCNDFEEKIAAAAKSIASKIDTPPLEVFVNAEQPIQTKHTKIPLRRVIAVACVFVLSVVLLGMSVAGLCGYDVIDYFFGDPAFKEVQEQGLVTNANMVVEKDGIKVELKALFCDGDITYMTITAEGEAFDSIKPKRAYPNNIEFGNRIINRTKEVYITNGKNVYWRYSDKMYKKEGDGTFYSESSLPDGSQNGAMLIFYAAPKESTIVDIKIELENGAIYEFNQIELKVTPAYRRDVSDKNYIVDYLGSKGHIKEIKYSTYKVRFVVEWKTKALTYDEFKAIETYPLKFDRKTVINGKNYTFGLKPMRIGSDAETFTLTYDLVAANIAPQDTIYFNLHERTDNGSTGKLIETILTIPGETDA